jgi:branched-chain amino acid transport system substrate-binding protein
MRSWQKKGWTLGLWLALAGAVAAAGTDADGVEPGTIRLGMVNAQTGAAAALGQGMLAGAKAVFDDVNARGGVHGRRIVLRVADDAYEPEQTVEQTLQLVQQDKVLALFGYVGTPTVKAVLPLLADVGVPLVGVFSGSMSLRQPVTPQLFNLRASYDEEADMLMAHLRKQGRPKVAVVYQHDGFGMAVLSAMAQALQRDGQALHASASFQRNTLALKTALATMLEAEPDVIVIAGPYAPAAAFVQQARAKGLKSQFATVSFVGTESLLARLGEAANGMLISQVMPFPMDDDTAVGRSCRDVLKRYAAEVLTYVNFEGCVSAHLMVEGLRRAGPQPTRPALMAALEGMTAHDLGGFAVQFSDRDHQGSDTVFLTQVVNGRITKVH